LSQTKPFSQFKLRSIIC